jgi:hypothetical protein
MRCAVLLALLVGVVANEVTPIDKVITLIESLKKEVETDGSDEAKAYEEFACFCKDTTDKKSKSVNSGAKKIDVLSADVADKTQEQKDDRTQHSSRKKDHEDLNRKLEETKVRCAKEKAEYNAEAADLSKAIQGLNDAIKSMKDSKPSLLSIKQTLGKTFEMAEAMSLLKTPKRKAVASLLQQSASEPGLKEYDFHSNDIIDVCEELLVDYKQSKSDLDEEFRKSSNACAALKKSLGEELSSNKKAMEALDKNIEKLAKEIAQHREDLITSDGLLKDDEQYLKDLQARCEDRANDYDQRSAMRGDELAALEGALKVLKGTVADATKANVRALLLQSSKDATKPAAEKATSSAPKASVETVKLVSFLQDVESSGRALRGGLSDSAKREKALNVLRGEGKRLGSFALTSLADRVAADPFKKIKGLIQKLIERLLEESKNEATKKGFCDTELGKARKDREFRFTEANDLSADLERLEAKRDSLKQEIKQLKKGIKEETEALKETTKERNAEKKVNMETLKTAKDGLDGVNEALLVLRSFYKQAAKAAFVQASPVDEDTAGPGFSGNYKGAQGGMKAVFALLETIQSDFDRTLRKTEEAEAAAHRDFVEFSQVAEASLAGKKTKQELDEQDLETTYTSIAQKTDDMQTAIDLLDSALKELEELKPTCIDTGMPYHERVEKREEEIKALQTAFDILS